MLDTETPQFASREEARIEAITLLLDGPNLPRLVFILAALGFTADASALLALQARILASLSIKRTARRGSTQPTGE